MKETRTERERGRWGHGALGVYALAAVLPAVVPYGERIYGFQAAILSYLGLAGVSEPETLGHLLTAACVLGAAANTLFFTAYVAFVVQHHLRKRPRTMPVVAGISVLGAVLAGGCGVLLLLEQQSVRVMQIGFIFWPGAMALLAWGAMRTNQRPPDTP